jgi:hypothetical protein
MWKPFSSNSLYVLRSFAQNHKFSKKNSHLPKWRDFKIKFSRPLFTIISRPKIAILDTESILRAKTMVVLLPYNVLIRKPVIWRYIARSTVVIIRLWRELKCPAFIDFVFFSNISDQMMI